MREDDKSRLQQRLQARGGSLLYEVAETTGPDHDRRYRVILKIDGYESAIGEGRSKAAAEQQAARRALEDLDKP